MTTSRAKIVVGRMREKEEEEEEEEEDEIIESGTGVSGWASKRPEEEQKSGELSGMKSTENTSDAQSH